MEKRPKPPSSRTDTAKDAPEQSPADSPTIEPENIGRRSLGGALGGAVQFALAGLVLGGLWHAASLGFVGVSLAGMLGTALAGAAVAAVLGFVAAGAIGLVRGGFSKLGKARDGEEAEQARGVPVRSQEVSRTQAVAETKDIQADLARQQQALNQQPHKSHAAPAQDHGVEIYHDPTDKPAGYWQQKVRPNRAPQIGMVEGVNAEMPLSPQ